MTDWHILPGLKIDVLIACCCLSVNPQKTVCCSRYSASGHLQKFAADFILSTSQNSQPCKIFTLSLNSNQNLDTPAPLNSRFLSQSFKISFVLFNQEIVMQHFDLYSKYSILITIFDSLKFLFREPRFHPSSPSSPFPCLSRLKTLEIPIEPPAHLAFFAFEVPDPDIFDTVICFNSASSSSELITFSSQAFSCSWDRIHSLCFCNLFAWLGKLFTLDSRFKQKELCRLSSRSSPSLPQVSTLSP